MRIAETVTFAGVGLDRAAQLRTDPGAMTRLREGSAARVVPVWRGKPLMAGAALGRLPSDHALFGGAGDEVFLALDDAAPVFARDVSAWQPEEMPQTLGAFLDPSEQHHPALPRDHCFVELRGAMTRLSAVDAELAATARALLGWHATHGHCARCGARSEIAEGGWQRLCPACGARHFPRTDPVVIMLVTHGNSVLLGRSPGWPERLFSLLAGFVEPGETIEAAVRRETFEETAVRVAEVGYLASQPWPFPASLMIGCRARATSTDITRDPAELADARWLRREEVMAVFAGEHPEVSAPRSGALAHFLLRAWLADRLD